MKRHPTGYRHGDAKNARCGLQRGPYLREGREKQAGQFVKPVAKRTCIYRRSPNAVTLIRRVPKLPISKEMAPK